jgi:hypothetical protein
MALDACSYREAAGAQRRSVVTTVLCSARFS